jgi:hypothetical protein
MKKIIVKSFVVFFAAIFLQVPLQAQFVVKVRPVAPVIITTRPLAPGTRPQAHMG